MAMTTDRWARTIVGGAAVFVVLVTLAACATNKAPAEAAIAAAETAVNSAVADARTYVPDQAASLEASLTTVKEKFTKGDYTAAINDAKALSDRAKDVASAAAAKKTELTKTWENLSAGMPQVVETIKGRVDILSQSKKLPPNMTADKLAEAKSGLGEITEQWTAATEAAKGGNLTDAISKGTYVKAKAADVLTTLGMPVPDALKG
jgi:hypothetical protein